MPVSDSCKSRWASWLDWSGSDPCRIISYVPALILVQMFDSCHDICCLSLLLFVFSTSWVHKLKMDVLVKCLCLNLYIGVEVLLLFCILVFPQWWNLFLFFYCLVHFLMYLFSHGLITKKRSCAIYFLVMHDLMGLDLMSQRIDLLGMASYAKMSFVRSAYALVLVL